jgi:hypothetical protein
MMNASIPSSDLVGHLNIAPSDAMVAYQQMLARDQFIATKQNSAFQAGIKQQWQRLGPAHAGHAVANPPPMGSLIDANENSPSEPSVFIKQIDARYMRQQSMSITPIGGKAQGKLDP